MKRYRVPWGVALLTLLVLGLGCGIPPNRISFPERMAEANKKLQQLALKFRSELLPLGAGPGPNLEPDRVERVKKLYKEIQEAVAQLKRDYNPGTLPSRSSEHAPLLLEAYRKLVAVQDTIVTEHLQKVVEILEDAKLDRAEKWRQISEQLDAARELETPVLKDVKKAQKEYAEEHYYSLVPERPKE